VFLCQIQLDELDPRLRGDDGLFVFIVIPAQAGIQSAWKMHYISALLLGFRHKKQVSVDSENFLLHFYNDFKV